MNGIGRVEPFMRYSVGTDFLRQLPVQFHLRRGLGSAGRGTPAASCAAPDRSSAAADRGPRTCVSPSNSTSSTASVVGRDQQVEMHDALAGQAQVPAIHQVAGARAQRHDFLHRLGRALQAIEHQQRHAAMFRQGLRGHDRFGDQGQRSFGADDQLGQIQMTVGQHVGQLVAGAIDQALRLMAIDRRLSRAESIRPVASPAGRGATAHRNGRPRAARGRLRSPGRRPARVAGCCTCRRAEPYFSQWLPPASMASTLPIVVTDDIAGSGPNCRPCGFRCSFSRACTTPG